MFGEEVRRRVAGRGGWQARDDKPHTGGVVWLEGEKEWEKAVAGATWAGGTGREREGAKHGVLGYIGIGSRHATAVCARGVCATRRKSHSRATGKGNGKTKPTHPTPKSCPPVL